MGFDKCRLPFGKTTLLDRIVDTLATRASRIVVSVRAMDQQIDLSGRSAAIVPDVNPDCGPLEGLRSGLEYLAEDCEFAFVAACDTPWVDSAVIDFLLEQIGNFEAAIPIHENRVYGLNAVYRTKVHSKLAALIAENQLRVRDLPERLDTILIKSDILKSIDPQLYCLRNVNRPQDYARLLDEFKLDCDPAIARQIFGNADENS